MGKYMNLSQWMDMAKDALADINVAEIRETGILPNGGSQFFPVIGYPPLTMFQDMDQTGLFDQ